MKNPLSKKDRSSLAKKYGSIEAGKAVAAAAMYKGIASRKRK